MPFVKCPELCPAHSRDLLKKARKTHPPLNPPEVPALWAWAWARHPYPCYQMVGGTAVHRRPPAGLCEGGGNSLEPPPHLVQAASGTGHGRGLWHQAGVVVGQVWVSPSARPAGICGGSSPLP